ncbi:MAG: ribonuclease HII, partial [Rickettsiales bacterium]
MSINNFDDIKNNIIGIDEVGRGAWSGPVVACAVLLKKKILENSLIYQINDSKKVNKKTRNILDIFIRKNSFYSFGICDSKKIDSENIVNATKFAIIKAYKFFEHKKN